MIPAAEFLFMDRKAAKIPSSNFSRFRFAPPLLGISHYARYQEAHTTPLLDSGLNWRLRLGVGWYHTTFTCHGSVPSRVPLGLHMQPGNFGMPSTRDLQWLPL